MNEFYKVYLVYLNNYIEYFNASAQYEKAIALIDKANEIIRKLAEIGTSGGEPDKGYEGWRPNTSGTWYPCSTKDYRIWYEDDGTYRVRIG